MRKHLLYAFVLSYSLCLFAQKNAADFGYRHHKLIFEKDTVHILIKSKLGEEHIKKPVLFEVQGSTIVPLIVHNGEQLVLYATITESSVESDYHLVMVNKPGLPLMCHVDSLTKGKFKDPITKLYPQACLEKNNLDYYVRRNNTVINYLKTQAWVDPSKLVVVGHSEGSSVAAHMADKIEGITHLVYSGGGPYYPRILDMVQQERDIEEKEGGNPWVNKTFDYWKNVIKDPFITTSINGWNTNFGTYSFSQNENEVLKRLKIPVLISYGTKDTSAPYNDMFHIETIKDKVTNITFKAYVGLAHNYNIKDVNLQNGDKVDYLGDVIGDWLQWINSN